ncbi:MAG: lamin tail domain-containing protein [Anaerolineae bacterium]|nr:lamin tail domain-containing protein [Anaerolineae bacterium]
MKRKLLAALLLFGMVGATEIPLSVRAALSHDVLITAVYFDPSVTGEASEAVELRNVGAAQVDIGGWGVGDGEGTVRFPTDAVIEPKEAIWVARSAAAFLGEFGHLPAYEYGGDSMAEVVDMTGSVPTFTNTGDQVFLFDADNAVVDAMVYGDATLGGADWTGGAVQRFDFGSSALEGQILYRKLRELDGMPVKDTNALQDWAQDPLDTVRGKKVRYPGWDLEQFFQTVKSSRWAEVKYCVAPDHLYECMRDEINGAMTSIEMEMYSLDSAPLIDALLTRLDAGVSARILLDASAMDAQGKWGCQQIEQHGGECWLMESKPQAKVRKRYFSQHAKWLVIDGTRALVGSENMSADAMPADDKGDGTKGSRGGFLVTSNAQVAHAAREILRRDLDPEHHADVRRWGTSTDDFPPFGFVPDYKDGGDVYAPIATAPFASAGKLPMQVVQCPENCLRVSDGLLGLVKGVGQGDTLSIEMLYEYLYWGEGKSNAERDPNPRLEAYIAAAKRGARVRILLDSFYDDFSDPRSNYETCVYVNRLSREYDIECRLANPTGLGIHIKLALVEKGGSGFVHLGSINGSETSNKLNRELAVQVESSDAHAYWKGIFEADWAGTDFAPHERYLPMLLFEK